MSMRTGSTRLDTQQAARAALLEKRVMMGCSLAVMFGVLLWVISISTEYWFSVTCPRGARINTMWRSGVGPAYLLSSHSGLWRTCETMFTNSSENINVNHGNSSSNSSSSNGSNSNIITAGSELIPTGVTSTICHYMSMGFIEQLSTENPLNVIIAYRRTCLGFSVISFLLVGMAIFFSVYTFRVRRYTFKRVAACLHFIVAGVELVVIEVQVTSLHYQEIRVPSVFPSGCSWNYSVSFVLGWICFVINLAAGVGFVYASTKKKRRIEGGSAAAEEDDFDDEPQIMGR